MQSPIGTLKLNLVYHRLFRTRDEAQANLLEFLERFYNRGRRHSAPNYLSPEAYQQGNDQQSESA
jgi:transposase InsO family protein